MTVWLNQSEQWAFKEGYDKATSENCARIAALEAENAALKAALKAAYEILKAALEDADEQNAALKAERDKFKALFTHSEKRVDLATDINRNLAAERAVARQSRARLVRLVRALRVELTTAWSIEAVAERECEEATTLYDCAKRYSDELAAERDAARQSRARLVRLVRYFKRVMGWAKTEYANAVATIESLQAERDAARAWAAVWKRAATGWRARGLFDALAFSNNFTRKKRLLDVARRAAEAMERR